MTRPGLTRRAALALPALAFTDRAVGGPEDGFRHGLSVFGDLKYPADFSHFDYVNPDAPVGGVFIHIPVQAAFNQSFQTFNSLNSFILRGEGPLQMELTFASLMTRADDEPDALYGMAAEAVRLDRDAHRLVFKLRAGLTFHDGSPLTADDVVWSLLTLKEKGHPSAALTLRDMEGASAASPDVVDIKLAPAASRDLPLSIAGMPIFSKAYYAKRTFDETTLDVPLGSGPYKVKRFEQGRFIDYERVADWWGWRVPAMRGQLNYARIRVEYFRDRSVAFEAFKAGQVLYREEYTSRDWATGYDFPALRDGKVKREEIPDETPTGTQGYFFNLRRAKFADARIREALGYAFDFEFTNKNLFYGLYRRNQSFFENSPMAARGLPSAEELKLLEPLRALLPEGTLGEAVSPPVSDGSGADRALLRKAAELLRAAGVKTEKGQARFANGDPFSFEFMIVDPSSERITLPYVENLKRLGIDARIRRVDPAQYQARLKDYDFDMVSARFSTGLTPNEGLKRLFSSLDAATPGSHNLAGISNEGIDRLIDIAVKAETREALYVAARALDRALRALRPWVPQWYRDTHWLAYWDIFNRPAIRPKYGRGVIDTWWIDSAKAKALGKGLVGEQG